ncbi:MAG: dipeptide/oligopeptide/nickel ABC transporter permease/ATP-binding protein [Alphaproteobacteria bacterium]
MWPRVRSTLLGLPAWQKAVLVIWLAIIVITVIGPWIAPFPTETANPNVRLVPPGGAYWLGTDENGIDILSRILAAPRTDVVIALAATVLSLVIGAPLGILVGLLETSGFVRSSVVAEAFMRLLEVIQSFPVFVFAMVLVAVFGGSITNIIAAVAFVNMPVFLRLARAEVLSLRQRPFAEAAISVGNTDLGLGFKHLLPNAMPTLVVQISVTVGFAILLTAGLSFVGAGVRPPTPELGNMIASGSRYLIIGQWWPAVFPGIALGLIVFSFGVVGEILNQALEPRALRDRSAEAAARKVMAAEGAEAQRAAREAEAAAAAVGARAEGDILNVERLSVETRGASSGIPILSEVSFSLKAGETMAIVGESGSGKSVLVRSLLQVLPPGLEVAGGNVLYRNRELIGLLKRDMHRLRSREIAAILPNAKSQLNPLVTVGDMMASALRAHQPMGRRAARQRAVELLTMVGITDPERRLSAFPHELSGGMAQRVCVALALMHQPSLLIADEPTAGLDVTIQRQVLDLIRRLARESGAAQLVITGDLGIAAHYCDKIAVMQAGRVVEANATEALFAAPRHPYTRHLIQSVQV